MKITTLLTASIFIIGGLQVNAFGGSRLDNIDCDPRMSRLDTQKCEQICRAKARQRSQQSQPDQDAFFGHSITLLSSLLVAVITAFVTVKLSLRRFYTERWWEKKAEAYSQIVEALCQYKKYDDEKLEIEMKYPRDDKKEREKILSEQWKEANAELEKAVDLGSFIVSAEVESIIKNFLKRRIGDPNYDPLFEIIETDLIHVKNCLSDVKTAAKKDLGIK